jgi:hypothetical protein
MTGLRSAVAECFIALELVGRRVGDDVPLNKVSSIADFALDVAVIRGTPIPDWERLDLAALPVRAVLDGATMATGTGAMVLGHPLKALLWLATVLAKRGDRLRNGDIVLTGTCTGITKVGRGQIFAGYSPIFHLFKFASRNRVSCGASVACRVPAAMPKSACAAPDPRKFSRGRSKSFCVLLPTRSLCGAAGARHLDWAASAHAFA